MIALRHSVGSHAIRFAVVVVAVLIAFIAELLRPPLISQFDERLRDMAVRAVAISAPEERIAIVDIDEESIATVGPWPWSRSRVADLVDILLERYGAASVALDIVFPTPADQAGDLRLAALAEFAPLILAQVMDYGERQVPLRSGTLLGGVPLHAEPGIRASGFLGNHEGLQRARCVGNIGFIPDEDGVLRRLPMVSVFNGLQYPHFSSTILVCTSNQDQERAGVMGFLRVPFHRALDAYRVVSAKAVLSGLAPSDSFRGRHVIVGSSSLSVGDRASTPLAALTPGSLVHASSLSALMDIESGSLSRPWSGRLPLLFWTIATVLAAALAMARSTAWRNVFLLIGISASWGLVAVWGVRAQVDWSISAPFLAYFFLLLVGIPNEWWQSQRETKRVLDTFSHYVAQPVLDEIVVNGLTPSLAPTLREVTVLIADMEGYTRATSQLPLSDAAMVTKDFLDCLTRPVLAAGGTLDKYSGDGLVAFWGAPLPCIDQADRAVDAAREILREVEEMSRTRRPKGINPLRVRIGIESGLALVGDLGTAFRSTYTAVGDCINFASRLESSARDFSTPVLIGPHANSRLTRYETYCAGSIDLRGADTSIKVFSLDFDRLN